MRNFVFNYQAFLASEFFFLTLLKNNHKITKIPSLIAQKDLKDFENCIMYIM